MGYTYCDAHPEHCSNGGRPRVVVLCGSTRFVEEFNRQRQQLTYEGKIVLSIEIVTTQAASEDPQHVDPQRKALLDELHLRKIDLADEVLVLNVGGYIGDSTRSEIEYAEKLRRPIRYLETCRRCELMRRRRAAVDAAGYIDTPGSSLARDAKCRDCGGTPLAAGEATTR